MPHDVVIIGAGPAGIFAARTLIQAGVRDIVILEKGDDIAELASFIGIIYHE